MGVVKMAAFKAGDFVGVECEVQPAPFSGERLVTIQTVDGAISGFVRDSELRQSGEHWWIRAKVLAASEHVLEVVFKGSFLTTNGLANVPPHTAMMAA